MLRDIAVKVNLDDDHGDVIKNGFVITHAEPNLVVTSDGVYHFSFRNPLLKVGSSLEEFLASFYESGCFGSHNFKAHWDRVGKFVKSKKTPDDNKWVQAYLKQFPNAG